MRISSLNPLSLVSPPEKKEKPNKPGMENANEPHALDAIATLLAADPDPKKDEGSSSQQGLAQLIELALKQKEEKKKRRGKALQAYRDIADQEETQLLRGQYINHRK